MNKFLVFAVLILGNGVVSEKVRQGGNCRNLEGKYTGYYIDDEPSGNYKGAIQKLC